MERLGSSHLKYLKRSGDFSWVQPIKTLWKPYSLADYSIRNVTVLARSVGSNTTPQLSWGFRQDFRRHYTYRTTLLRGIFLWSSTILDLGPQWRYSKVKDVQERKISLKADHKIDPIGHWEHRYRTRIRFAGRSMEAARTWGHYSLSQLIKRENGRPNATFLP